MDENLSILLNSEKNIDSINVDGSMKIELLNKPSLINEYNIRNVLSVTELFETERQETQIYRIYGRIEYLSLLNGVRSNYNSFIDFFNPSFDSASSKSIFNSFDFYLVRPSESGYTQNINNGSQYNRFFKVIATPNQFEIYKVGFAKNIFDEQTYAFNFTVDVDISELRDDFGMPLTELFIYAQYNRSGNEMISFSRWSNSGVATNESFSTTSLSVGSYVSTVNINNRIGDYVEYNKLRFWQTQITPQTFRISTPIIGADLSNDTSKKIIMTQSTCDLAETRIDNMTGEIYREFRQNLTFTIQESQPQDTTILYRIITQYNETDRPSYTNVQTGSTVILSGQTSTILTGLLCRNSTRTNIGGDLRMTSHIYEEIITYELITTHVGEVVDGNINIIWKYNPFIPIRLRHFEDNISRANSGSTSYDTAASIPEFATNIGNGNFVWREILPEGYSDPITGIGTNHPFINKRRYVFSTIILDVTPDLDDGITRNLFQNLWFNNDVETINIRPINNINQINKPCQ